MHAPRRWPEPAAVGNDRSQRVGEPFEGFIRATSEPTESLETPDPDDVVIDLDRVMLRLPNMVRKSWSRSYQPEAAEPDVHREAL